MGADVLICDPVRFLSWSSKELEAFIGEQPEIGAVVQRLLGRCLVRKLHHPNEVLMRCHTIFFFALRCE